MFMVDFTCQHINKSVIDNIMHTTHSSGTLKSKDLEAK